MIFIFLTERGKSKELTYLETLSTRAELTTNENKTLDRLRKGYEGEKLYDQILDEVGHDAVNIYRDIWIKADKSLAQIDSLIISDDLVIVNEIKNYSGQYKYENNIWHVGKFQISDDPIIQVKRASSKLIKIFRENNISVNVDSKVIFPNPYFILSTNDEICKISVIKRDRIKNYFRTFNTLPNWDKSRRIIDIIDSYRVPEPGYTEQADYDRLSLGRYCFRCKSFNLENFRSYTECKGCNYKVNNKMHVLKAVQDYEVLFHGQKVTTTAIEKLLNHEISNSTIKRNLRRHCVSSKQGRFRTYSLQHVRN